MHISDTEILNEAYYGKAPDLVDCENLIAKIRSNYDVLNNGSDISYRNNADVKKLAEILGVRFNCNISLAILTVRPLSLIAGTTAGMLPTGLLMTPLMSVMPNAFTFGVGNTSYLTPIKVIETSDRISFAKKQDITVRITALLFFSSESTPADILAVILHEIGHNFFLVTNIRFLRALNNIIMAAGEFYIDVALANAIDKLPRSIGLQSRLLLRTIDTLSHLVPSIGTGFYKSLEVVFSKVEKALRFIVPKSVTDVIDKSLKSYKLNTGGILTSYAFLYIGVIFNSIFNGKNTAIVINVAISKVFLQAFNCYKFLAPMFLGYRQDEMYADNFAVAHGYGPQVARFSEIFSKMDTVTSVKMSPNDEVVRSIWRTIEMATMTLDPHPANVIRIKRSADFLRAELANPDLPSAHRKTIESAIKSIDTTYDRFMKSHNGTIVSETLAFNTALADYSDGLIPFSKLMTIAIDTLKGNTVSPIYESDDSAIDKEAERIVEHVSEIVDLIPSVLHEGLGSVIKDLVTGDIDKEIRELQGDVKDIHTPEQQRIVVGKIVNILERLIRLRHQPTSIETFVHDSTALVQRAFGGRDAGKELKIRTSEAIAKLARLRDTALSKKWDNTEYNERVEKLRTRVQDLMQKANGGSYDD